MKIDRLKLVEDLDAFSRAGNGVVVGSPGVGKSYILFQLRERLQRIQKPHLILPVQMIGEGTPQELENVLKRKGELNEVLLSSVQITSVPGILIFDGFDAARGDRERAGILNLISSAIEGLRGKWNVLVSVRRFDAKKSQKLLSLFPSPELSNSDIQCRHFLVPELQSEELEQVFKQLAGLREIYERGNEELQNLLKIPFQLWLVEQIIVSGIDPKRISPITSEVQLLDLFWERRVRSAVDREDREFVLRDVALAMIQHHSLVIRRDKVYQPNLRRAWSELLSDEILVTMEEREEKVEFSHNILFDFATSVHVLERDPSDLAKFLAADSAMPLFLRPSLVFHFTWLWHFDRSVFWKNFWVFIGDREIRARYIVRLLLPAVILNEANDPEDLSPIIERLSQSDPAAVEGTAFLLQALRALNTEHHDLWIHFIRAIANHWNTRFAWDAGDILLRRLGSTDPATPETRATFNEIGRSLLTWAWNLRVQSYEKWCDRLIASVAIPLVAKTFGSACAASGLELKKILGSVGMPDFPIDCLLSLTQEVKSITPLDAGFVGSVYERVFGHEETSDEKTTMGGSVFSLISNRRQDFGTCRYVLLEEFPKFLAAAPDVAIRAGIRSAQAFVIRKHILPYSSRQENFEAELESFTFRGRLVHYAADGSHVWNESSYPDQELKIADEIFDWFEAAVKEEREESVEFFLDVLTAEARVAYFWGRLLLIGAENTRALGPKLFELALARPILENADTLYETGEFLAEATESFTPAQRKALETILMNLPSRSLADELDRTNRVRDRLIRCIPKDLLVTAEAKELRELIDSRPHPPTNDRLVRFESSCEDYTEDDFIRDQGADLAAAENQTLRSLYNPLVEWLNGGKDVSQIAELLGVAVQLRDLLIFGSKADPPVLRSAWTHLAEFASKAVLESRPEDRDRFEILKDILLLLHSNPDPEPDPESDARYSSPHWCPAPRNEVARTLPWISTFSVDERVIKAIQKLANDPVPSVRFLLGMELWRTAKTAPDFMWTLFDEWLKKEENRVVLYGLLLSLWKSISRDNERAFGLLEALLGRTGESLRDHEEYSMTLVTMTTDLAVGGTLPWAEDALIRWDQDPLRYASCINGSVRHLLTYIQPMREGLNFDRSLGFLLAHLDAVANGLTEIQKKTSAASESESEETTRSLYNVIDQIIAEIYFASDASQSSHRRSANQLSNEARQKYFRKVLPLLEKILKFGQAPETGLLLASTAHHFMEFLVGALGHDPPLVLRFAAGVVESSKRFNYHLDSLALGDIVELVESILADYRGEVQDNASIENLLSLLDAFVEAGWPQAVNLIWRLDEIYR